MPRWPTRSAPATCAPSSSASATRRWRSPANRRCARRWPSWTSWWRSRPGPRPRPTWPPTSCRWPTTSSAATCVWGYLQAEPFLRWAPAVVEPVGERRPQWWIVAELARRLGLPVFGSKRRDAALADRHVDDEVIAESILGARAASVGRGARRALRDPRHVGRARLAGPRPAAAAARPRPVRARRAVARRPAARAGRSGAGQPTHAGAVQLVAPRGGRPGQAGGPGAADPSRRRRGPFPGHRRHRGPVDGPRVVHAPSSRSPPPPDAASSRCRTGSRRPTSTC